MPGRIPDSDDDPAPRACQAASESAGVARGRFTMLVPGPQASDSEVILPHASGRGSGAGLAAANSVGVTSRLGA